MDHPERSQRETCLPWMLGFLFLGFTAVLLIIATGGYFAYVMALAGAVGLVALMHYTLWGRSLGEQAALEREAEEERQRILDAERWPFNRGDGRFRRPGGDH